MHFSDGLHHNSFPNARLSKRLGTAVLFVAGCLLLSWVLGLDRYDGLYTHVLSVKANAALCLMLLSVTLIVRRKPFPFSYPALAHVPVVLATCIAIITLCEISLGWDSGISQLLSPDTRSTVSPGRMAPLTAATIVVLCISMLFSGSGHPRTVLWSQWFAIVAMIAAAVTLLAHLYGASDLLYLSGQVPMAWITALLIMLLGLAILTSRPEAGIAAHLCSGTAAARMGRQLLVMVFIALPALAWIRIQGQALQLYSTEIGTALVVTAGLGMMSALIVLHTSHANHAEIRLHYLNRVYSVLSEINSLIVRVTNKQELFSEASRIAVDHGGFSAAWFGVPDENGKFIVPVAGRAESSGGNSKRLSAWLSLESDDGGISPVARAVRSGFPVISNDVAADENRHFRDELLSHGIHSFAIFPLMVSGKVSAIFELHAPAPHFFHKDECRLLTELAGDIMFAIHHLEQKSLLDYLAYFDSLTGLANPRLLEERLGQAIAQASRHNGTLAVAVLDIFPLRTINEAFGRQVGDEALKVLSARLANTCRDANVGRLGSTMFAIMLDEAPTEAAIVLELERITATCFGQRFDIFGKSLTITARAGIAILDKDGDTARVLLDRAEAAVTATGSSAQRYRFYDQESNQRTAERLALQNALAHALDNDEFRLDYQVKVDCKSFIPCGAEALLRWNSATLGPVEPGRFITILEDTGLIGRVGTWALRQASSDSILSLRRHYPGFRIAVNVSASQLLRPDFVEQVKAAFGDHTAMADIDLELTESLVMTDIESSISKLRRLRALGMKIAIDDFGTGYSSMAYLARLPLDYLKIDRAFVVRLPGDSESITVISSIISLGHALGLKVIAEGIEELAQAELLASLGCDQLQGFYFGRPEPLTTLLARLARH